MKLYISGPITGNPAYREQFLAAENDLTAFGYDTYNPAANPLENPAATWHDYMRRDILVIAKYMGGLALLPGWENSEGATLEVLVAKAFQLPIHTTQNWINRGMRGDDETRPTLRPTVGTHESFAENGAQQTINEWKKLREAADPNGVTRAGFGNDEPDFATQMAQKSLEALRSQGTTDPAPTDCNHFWIHSETRDGTIKECPNCGTVNLEKDA